jgi:MbtH protein
MTNPFEEEKTNYYALTNDEGQFSLWPASIEVPSGWTIAAGPSNRNDCISYVETHWSDMRPRSLIESQRSL